MYKRQHIIKTIISGLSVVIMYDIAIKLKIAVISELRRFTVFKVLSKTSFARYFNLFISGISSVS